MVVGMTVAKRKAGGAVVAASRETHQGELVVRIRGKPAIAKGGLAFVSQDEQTGCRHARKITGPGEGEESAVRSKGVGILSHPAVYGKAAHAPSRPQTGPKAACGRCE